jgi:uncharacterized protein YkwD
MVATVSFPPRPARRARRIATGAVLAAAAASCLMAAAPAALATTAPCRDAMTPMTQASRADMQRAVLCLVNQRRAAAHLPSLVASSKLDLSAQRWTNSMIGNQDFSHGTAFTQRITAVGFDWTAIGENIATGFTTPESVVKAWMASPGHCANILDPTYREAGTGLSVRYIHGAANIDGTWTQDFGRLMGQSALSSNDGPAQACFRH